MPLPAALQAKLFKRGIIKTQKSDTEPEEEIIAEDYDDHKQQVESSDKPQETVVVPADDKENKLAIGCPNKWNIYHECSSWCVSHWGDGIKTPNPNDERKRFKMLKKYPLPDNWQEIYDPGVGRFYYWNVETVEVSWMPPKHPRAKVSLPAATLREIMKKEERAKKSRKEHDEDSEDSRDDRHREDRHERRRERERERDRDRDRSRGRSGRHREGNDLDPMDPAAYSDIPRGTWSSGLERKGEAKTGADTTASGPLYQMRPYPSPGAVLRANADLQSKDKT